HWAIASTMRTPGMIGFPGKWPVRYHSSSRTRLRATTRTPGSISVTSSSSRKGSRCGRIASIPARSRAVTGGSRYRPSKALGRGPEGGPGALPGAVHVALRRADRHARGPRDVVVRKAHDVAEHDDG